MANFTVRPPGGTLHKDPMAFFEVNELLKPLGFSILSLNGWSVSVVGDGFRQEAIRAIYGYFSREGIIKCQDTSLS